MVILSSSGDSNNTLVSLGNSPQQQHKLLPQQPLKQPQQQHTTSQKNRFQKRSKPNGGLTPMRRVGSLELLQQAVTQQEHEPQEPLEFEATHLYLPMDDYELEDEFVQDNHHAWKAHNNSSDSDSEDSFFSCESTKPQEALYLPKLKNMNDSKDNASNTPQSNNIRMPVDECFSHLPSLRDAGDVLVAQSTRVYNKDQRHKLLYVGQGEVAHCVPLQTDVILSDRATTCHIMMLFSTSSANVPLATCAHLDSTSYNLQDVWDEHVRHHRQATDIEMDAHIVGGYTPQQQQAQALQDEDEEPTTTCDATATSRKLSQWLVYELARLAQHYAKHITCTLQTALLSSLNTCRQDQAPLARGLALHVKTGQVWLAHLQDPAAEQPEYLRRQAALWFRGQQEEEDAKKPTRSLTLIHSATRPTLFVPECHVPAFLPELEQLAHLPDALLLHYTSTSPLCEGADFAATVRATIDFWRAHQGQTLPACEYKRNAMGIPAEWRRVGA